jgi:hypothetical protein
MLPMNFRSGDLPVHGHTGRPPYAKSIHPNPQIKWKVLTSLGLVISRDG